MSKCKVSILAQGYSKDATSTSMRANCSCVLVQDGPINIIVDTMTAWDSKVILEGLEKVKLLPENINFVVTTHGHSDHCGNNNLFLMAKHITGNSISHGDYYEFHDFDESNYTISPNVQVQRTAGHTMECVSVRVVNSNYQGTVVITGDLFEKEEDINDPSIWIEAGSHNERLHRRNRQLISQDADYIIPGHGPMFQMSKLYRELLKQQTMSDD